MSLNGCVAKQDNTIGPLFDWLRSERSRDPDSRRRFHRSPDPAERGALAAVDVLRGSAGLWPALFEVADGWQGRHTMEVPVVVVTHRVPREWVEAHPEAPFTL